MKDICQVRFPDGRIYLLGKNNTKKIKSSKKEAKNDNS